MPAPLLLCPRHTPLGPGPGLYAVQVPPATHSGPGPPTFWTWCHFTPWTWSSHHAPQVPQSHTRWTWSTTLNCTAARYRPHQGQNSVTPRPNTPWTWSKALCRSSTSGDTQWTWSNHFLDVVPFHPLDLVQPPCPTGTPELHSVDLVHHTKLHRGQMSATPRPKHSHTSAKHPLDMVQDSMPFKYLRRHTVDLVHPLFGRGVISPP